MSEQTEQGERLLSVSVYHRGDHYSTVILSKTSQTVEVAIESTLLAAIALGEHCQDLYEKLLQLRRPVVAPAPGGNHDRDHD